MFRKIIAGLIGISVTAACFVSCGDKPKDNPGSVPANKGVLGTAQALNFTAPVSGEEIVVLTVEGYGEIKIKVFQDLVPNGSENFKGLANREYYDGLIFHRIIKGFMIQGGSPNGDGIGGQGFSNNGNGLVKPGGTGGLVRGLIWLEPGTYTLLSGTKGADFQMK